MLKSSNYIYKMNDIKNNRLSMESKINKKDNNMDQNIKNNTFTDTTSCNSINQNNSIECASCKEIIKDRYMLKALNMHWHEDCLKCSCCQCRLAELGSTLFSKENLILCRRDYLKLFGSTGLCSACHKNIPAFEMVMRAKQNVFHLECFACQQCSHRFCVGDRYYLCDNKILCEYDYEERLIFAKMTLNYEAVKRIKMENDMADNMKNYTTNKINPTHQNMLWS